MFSRRKDEAAEVKPEDEQKSEGASNPLPFRPSQAAGRSAAGRMPVSRPEIARRATDIRGATGAESKRLVVGREIVLHGEINACDMLIVEGNVEASLSDCREIDICETGIFKGEAEVDSAEIGGTFDGALAVRGTLTVRATGLVAGKVTYGQLEVERGGRITGDVRVFDATQHPAGEDRPVAIQSPSK